MHKPKVFLTYSLLSIPSLINKIKSEVSDKNPPALDPFLGLGFFFRDSNENLVSVPKLLINHINSSFKNKNKIKEDFVFILEKENKETLPLIKNWIFFNLNNFLESNKEILKNNQNDFLKKYSIFSFQMVQNLNTKNIFFPVLYNECIKYLEDKIPHLKDYFNFENFVLELLKHLLENPNFDNLIFYIPNYDSYSRTLSVIKNIENRLEFDIHLQGSF